MVEKKFNFYSIFTSYYKNINKTDKTEFLFLFIYDFIKDFRPELDPGYSERMLINYFGVFYILSNNFILYSNLNVLNCIIFNKRLKKDSRFNLKKIFYLNVLKKKKHLNKNIFLLNLI